VLIFQGGSFGGKEYRTFFVTLPAAIAAQRYYQYFNLLVRIAGTACAICGLLLQRLHISCSACVSLSVCVLVTTVSPAKTTEPTEMLFVRLTQMGARNSVLDGMPNFYSGKIEELTSMGTRL